MFVKSSEENSRVFKSSPSDQKPVTPQTLLLDEQIPTENLQQRAPINQTPFLQLLQTGIITHNPTLANLSEKYLLPLAKNP